MEENLSNIEVKVKCANIYSFELLEEHSEDGDPVRFCNEMNPKV